MTIQIDRVRLAITAFDEPERLWQTLNDLLGRGIDPGQMCLMGRPRVLKAACKIKAGLVPPAKLNRLAGLCAATQEFSLPALWGGGAFVASSGPLLDLLLQERSGSPFVKSSSEDDRRVLDDLAHADDVILVVQSRAPRQQLVATRAMLAGSLRRVTTHEYAMTARQDQAAG
jgi:hypothetical protein